MEVLLQSLVDLDIKDEKGRTALDLAAFRGHAECVEALISQGASVTVKDDVTRRTPLHASGERDLTFRLQHSSGHLHPPAVPTHPPAEGKEGISTRAEALQPTLTVHFLGLSSSVPVGQSSLAQSPVVSHTTTALPSPPACAWPHLSVTARS